MIESLGALVAEARSSAKREWWVISIGIAAIATAIVIAALS